MKAIISNDKISFDVKTTCQGVVFDTSTQNGEGVAMTTLASVKVKLISKSVRDKVLFELFEDDFKSLVGSIVFDKKLENSDPLYIPFALGDLDLNDDDYLEVEVSLLGTNDGDSIIYDRVITGKKATGPIAVKKLKNVSEFDSAYYNTLLTRSVVGFDYRNEQGEKTYVPKVFVSFQKNDNGVTAINLEQNKTYTVSNDAEILLVDH